MAFASYKLLPSRDKSLVMEKPYHLSDYQKKMLGDNTINRAYKIWSEHSLQQFKTKSAIVMKKCFKHAEKQVLCIRTILLNNDKNIVVTVCEHRYQQHTEQWESC